MWPLLKTVLAALIGIRGRQAAEQNRLRPWQLLMAALLAATALVLLVYLLVGQLLAGGVT